MHPTSTTLGKIKRLFFLSFCIVITLIQFKSYGQTPSRRVYANTVQKSADDFLLVVNAGNVQNEGNAVNGNPASFATLNSTVVQLLGLRIGGEATIRLRFTGAEKPVANTPVSVKIGLGGNLLSVLSGATIQAVNGAATNANSNLGNTVGPVYTAAQVANVLGGTNQVEFNFTPTQAYDGVLIRLASPQNLLSVGALTSLQVYHAYFKTPSTVACNTAQDVLFGNTGIIAGSLNPVDDPYNAIDGDENTSAFLRGNVSALNKTYVTALFPTVTPANDSVRLVVQPQGTGLLDATLLASNFVVRTYNGNVDNGPVALNPALLRLSLLGGTTNKYVVSYPVTTAFDRVEVSVGEGLVNALNGLNVFEIGRRAPSPTILAPGLVNNALTICEGALANITISNPEAGATYRYFDAATGGNEITAGVTDNGTKFSPPALTAGVYTYYVGMYRAGCSDAVSARTKITITVSAGAVSASIQANDVAICLTSPAQPAVLTAGLVTPGSIANPVFTYYFDAAKTQPVTNGTVAGVTYVLTANGLTVTGLTANKTFYVSVQGTGLCENMAGALKAQTVTVNSSPQPVIDMPGTQNFATGSNFTLTATSAGATSFQWFKDNVAIPGETAATLTRTNITALDAGTYYVVAIGAGGCSSIASATTTVNVAGLGSTKRISAGLNAQGKINAGSELTYTIELTNTGSSAVAGVTIADAIPAGTTYVAGSASNGGVLTGSTLNWTVNVPAGTLALTFRVTAAADLSATPSITNTANVTIPGDPTVQNPSTGPVPTNQISSFTSAKTISGLVGGQIASGSALTYTVAITNTGTVALTGVTVSDILPAGVTYVAGTASNGGTLTGNTLNWTVNVPFGQTVQLTFNVTAASNLTGIPTITNSATVTNPADPTNPQTPSTPPYTTNQNRTFTSTKTVTGLTAGNTIAAGSTLTYSIAVANTGNVDLTGVTITDAIPAGTTYIAGTADNGGTLNGAILNYVIDVPFGQTKTVSFHVKVNDDLTGISSIGNTATVTDPSNPGTPQNPTVPPSNTDQTRAFTSTKSVTGLNGAGRIAAGSELTYTINITNTGNTNLTGVTISDPIPANTTYVAGSADNAGALTSNTLNWTVDVPFGQSKAVTFKVKVTDNLTGVAAIGNVATVTDPVNPGTPQTPTVPPIATDPVRSFTSTKTVAGLNAGGKIAAGSTLTYTVSITNTGTTALTGITISDPIPANTTYVAGSADNGGALTGTTLNWTIDVPFGQTKAVAFQVKVADDLTGVPSIGNTATVTDPSNPGTPQTPSVPPTPTDPVRSFTSTKTVAGLNGAGKITAGSTLTFTISVQNTGSTALTGITISDPIPANTTYVAGSADNAGTLNGSTLNWTIDVPFGQTKLVTFQVKVADDLTGVPSIGNTATVIDPTNPGTPQTPTVPPVPTDPARSFTSTKAVAGLNGAGRIAAGSTLTYTINVQNTGSVALTGITISDPIPASTTYVAGSANNGGTLTGTTLNWTIDVPFGQSRAVTFQVLVASDLTGVGAIGNTATVTDPINPGTPQTPTVPPVPTDPNRSFNSTKTMAGLNAAGKIAAGSTLTYTINVQNTGSSALTGITISDPIPASTTYVPGSANNGGTFTSNTLNWTIDVPFGQSKAVTFQVKVADDLTGVPSIGNTATVTDPSNPTTPQTPTVPPATTDQTADFALTSTVISTGTDGKAHSGNQLTYTITVRNTGNVTLNNTTVNDPVPNSTTFTSAQNGGTLNAGTNAVGFVIPTLAPGASTTVSFTVTVNPDLTNTTTISNTATVINGSIQKTTQADIPVVCTTVSVASVTVNGGNGGNLCVAQGGNVTITATSTGVTNPMYYLYNGNTLAATNTTGVFVVSATPGTSYTYSVGISGTGICESSAAQRVSVTFTTSTIPPVPTVAQTSVDVCSNSIAVLTVTNPQANATYNWYTAATGGTLAGSGASFTTPALNASTSYFVEAVSAGGCTAGTRTEVRVNVLTRPSAPASVTVNTGVACSGTAATLTVNNPDASLTYRWFATSTGGTALTAGTTFTTPALAGTTTYYVEAVSAAGCISTTRTAVSVNVLPVLAAPIVTVQAATPTSVTFAWGAVTGALRYEVSLDGGINWQAPSSGSAGLTQLVIVTKPGAIANIRVRAVGQQACQTSAIATLDGNSSNPMGNGLFIPNTFTPNGDGRNDYFLIYGNTISTMTLRVYNQWGQFIFESRRPELGWDGTFKGQLQPNGVYVYYADVTFQDGTKTLKKGSITLLR